MAVSLYAELYNGHAVTRRRRRVKWFAFIFMFAAALSGSFEAGFASSPLRRTQPGTVRRSPRLDGCQEDLSRLRQTRPESTLRLVVRW